MPQLTVRNGSAAATTFTFAASRTLTDGFAIALAIPSAITVEPGGTVTDDLAATGDDWAWTVTASAPDGHGGTTTDRWAFKLTADANLADLPRLDPADFSPNTLPGWLAMARSTITSGSVNPSGHLILTRTDGTTIDAGPVTGPPGQPAAPTVNTTGIFTPGPKYTVNTQRAVTTPGGATIIRLTLTATQPFVMAAGANTFGTLNPNYRPPVELAGTFRCTGPASNDGGLSANPDGNLWTTSPNSYNVNQGDIFYLSLVWA